MSHFEIFILNYNGSRFLADCLSSLKEMSVDQHIVGINVVDNGSSDDSRSIVEKYHGFNFIPLHKNLGFSRGNNQGAWIRLKELAKQNKKPDFVMFLNNDTTADKNMIKSIEATFRSDQSVGVVGVRALFMDDFIPLSLNSDLREGQFIDIQVEGENLGQELRRYRVYKGAPLAGNVWRLRKDACLFIPLANVAAASKVSVRAINFKPEFSLLRSFYRKDNLFYKEHALTLNQSSFEIQPAQLVKLIQNAGSFVTSRLEAGDMGSFEIDSGQYLEDRELNSVCGVAMAMRTGLFKDLGGFDQHFFAYYEDTDLSLRALRKGYKCYYSGKAVINHLHAGSSGVGTNYFNFNVTYSKLYFLSKFASSALYRQRLAELKHYGRSEFDLYLQDAFVENKPNLKSYAKYLRFWMKFLINRVSRLLYLSRDRKISCRFIKEKYVNEY